MRKNYSLEKFNYFVLIIYYKIRCLLYIICLLILQTVIIKDNVKVIFIKIIMKK